MAASKPLQVEILSPIEKLISEISSNETGQLFDVRLQLLEATASKFGNFPIKAYFDHFGIDPIINYFKLNGFANQLSEAISRLSIHPALILSALASEPISPTEQRKNGAYYTDFRLAQYLANLSKPYLNSKTKVVDPASGAGILLSAVAVAACGFSEKQKYADWLAQNTFASDVSVTALRGARLALASLTNDLDAVKQMWGHWKVQDSLISGNEVWNDLLPEGFDLVVGNPPWEKLKLTRHEFLQSIGNKRYYGEDYSAFSQENFDQEKFAMSNYADILFKKYEFVGTSELDLYMAFVELFVQLLRPGGVVSALVPAGLIRSQGTEYLRRFLFGQSDDLSITILHNRSKFFAIDSRFKFVALSLKKSNELPSTDMRIKIHHATGNTDGVEITSTISLSKHVLGIIRPDLTIPEVRDNREWDLFLSMCQNGKRWDNTISSWSSEIVREIDMSKEKENFLQKRTKTALAVVEGRMIQIHRFGAKAYVSGSGRRSRWAPLKLGYSDIKPQYWIEKSHLNESILRRTEIGRAGFCDIAGQTNERSMMAALISPGVVCGNKVPTLIFSNDSTQARLLLWLGIVNSFSFDWLLRRVLTTTVNYFLLKSLPLPDIEPDGIQGRKIIKLVQQLQNLDISQTFVDLWKMAELRAEIDTEVLSAYRLGFDELELILGDFPLLDRGQPPILGERKSTITKDFLLLRASRFFKIRNPLIEKRVLAARKTGAIPYIISENAHVET